MTRAIAAIGISAVLLAACASQKTAEQAGYDISYTCVDGTKFTNTFKSKPGKETEEKARIHFSLVYGQEPESCSKES